VFSNLMEIIIALTIMGTVIMIIKSINMVIVAKIISMNIKNSNIHLIRKKILMKIMVTIMTMIMENLMEGMSINTV
jgi:predicted thioredoxin/glutaredoxin